MFQSTRFECKIESFCTIGALKKCDCFSVYGYCITCKLFLNQKIVVSAFAQLMMISNEEPRTAKWMSFEKITSDKKKLDTKSDSAVGGISVKKQSSRTFSIKVMSPEKLLRNI